MILEERVISTISLEDLHTHSSTAKSLDDLLLICIDEVLSDLLGRRAKEAVYDHLERNCNLARSEVPRHLNKFLGLLEETFGQGSKTIGRSIIRRLYDKLEWRFEVIPGYEFIDYLETIRNKIAKTLVDHAKINSNGR